MGAGHAYSPKNRDCCLPHTLTRIAIEPTRHGKSRHRVRPSSRHRCPAAPRSPNTCCRWRRPGPASHGTRKHTMQHQMEQCWTAGQARQAYIEGRSMAMGPGRALRELAHGPARKYNCPFPFSHREFQLGLRTTPVSNFTEARRHRSKSLMSCSLRNLMTIVVSPRHYYLIRNNPALYHSQAGNAAAYGDKQGLSPCQRAFHEWKQ